MTVVYHNFKNSVYNQGKKDKTQKLGKESQLLLRESFMIIKVLS